MKKYFKYLSFCVLAGVGLSSCEADDNGYKPDPVDLEGYAYLADRSITTLDQNQEVSIDLFTAEGVTFETVTIQDGDGNEIATATVSGETATFNTSALGEFAFGEEGDEVTGTFPITIVSTLSNGMTVEDHATISVGHAISLDGPSEIQYLDPRNPDDNVLAYSVNTLGAPVGDLTLEYKIGSEAEYQADDITAVDAAGGEIALTELDYDAYGLEVGDTLYYQFTASSGELTDVMSTSIAINPQAFTDGAAGTLTNDEGSLNLMTGENVAAGLEGGDITFDGTVAAPGFTATADSNIQFVETTEEIAGVLDAKAAFEAGTPVSTVSNVSNGDVIAYKVTREIPDEEEEGVVNTVTHYGYMTIGAVTMVDGETVTVEVSTSEGVAVGVETEAETEV